MNGPKDGNHFSRVCGKCRDPNALTLETYKNPDDDNYFSIVKVEEGDHFGNVNCANQTYEKGLYYDGMPCLNVKSTILSFKKGSKKYFMLNEMFLHSKRESLDLIAQRIS